MMWEYGAGNHSPAEYRQLMNRLNTGMRGEVPLGYDNYEFIECELNAQATNHAHTEWHTLNTLVKHAHLMIIGEDINNHWSSNMATFVNNNPNSINIFGCSSSNEAYNIADYHRWIFDQDIINLCNSKQFILFAA